MNFKNLEKCDNPKKCVKIYFSQIFKCLVFLFKLARPVYYKLKFDIKLHSNHFSSKKHIFAFFKKNNCYLKTTFLEDRLTFAH